MSFIKYHIMKYTFVFILVLFVIVQAKSQYKEQIVSSSGGSSVSNNYALTFTLGEPVVMTSVSDSYKLSIGFIGKELEADVITSLDMNKELSVTVYPNPFTEEFHIMLDDLSGYEINIYNCQGKFVGSLDRGQDKIGGFNPVIPAGCFYLELIKKTTSERSFEKIIKL